jgi:nitroreductase/NAD-dependent dihydropyrimidine dehydrogenase PreA subunit
MDKVMVDPESCTMCGLCIQVCPRGILVEGSATAQTVEADRCYYCGHCKAVCPQDALHFAALPEKDFAPVLPAEELQSSDGLLLRFRSRRTTRHFRPDPVEKEKIEKIILSGQCAPTGTNRQGVEYLIVQSPQALDKLREQTIEALAAWVIQSEKPARGTRGKGAAPQKQQAGARSTPAFLNGMKKKVEAHRRGEDQLFYNAPVLILCHTDPATTLFPEWEVALANMQMLLMAEALGLGTCLNGALIHALEHSPELRAALPIPAEHEIPVSFMVGYPALKFLRTVHRRPARATWL